MAYSVKILADSVAPCGKRLTTFELTYPRFVHSEFMTHRMFSRNSASSRAIPIEKMIERVMVDPVLPVEWGKNQPGMQAKELLDDFSRNKAEAVHLKARDETVRSAQAMLDLGVHKQIVNRLLEPWMWITVICSATEYGNFFNLRCHPDAQPEIRKLAEMMWNAYVKNKPAEVQVGDYHLPLVYDTDLAIIGNFVDATKVSVGRCARVSYLTHDGKRALQADMDLHDRLAKAGHWSPFEHVASALCCDDQSGNFRGWRQYRQTFADQNRPNFAGIAASA